MPETATKPKLTAKNTPAIARVKARMNGPITREFTARANEKSLAAARKWLGSYFHPDHREAALTELVGPAEANNS